MVLRLWIEERLTPARFLRLHAAHDLTMLLKKGGKFTSPRWRMEKLLVPKIATDPFSSLSGFSGQ